MVSIIIPVYNRALLVRRTLQSVLEQTFRPLEVVLVDNRSTDGTLEVLQDFKQAHGGDDGFSVIVGQEPNQGASWARNRGANMASGDYILFFDSDDVMEPYMIERYAEVAIKAGADMVGGRADVIDLNGGRHENPYYETDLLANNLFHACMVPSRCLLRRRLCESVGWWNVYLNVWDDWEFSMRMLLNNPKVAFYGNEVCSHVFLQRRSITGTDFSSKAGEWERAIDAVEQAVRLAAGAAEKERLLKYVDFRRVTLSGLYIGEGRRDLAIPLYNRAYEHVRHDCVARWLYPLLRSYIASGGRGASRIVKMLVK